MMQSIELEFIANLIKYDFHCESHFNFLRNVDNS